MTSLRDNVIQDRGGGLRPWLHDHQVLAFVLLAYAISWPLWVVGYLGGGMVAVVLGGLGPFASALVLTRYLGRPVGVWLRSLLVWRVPLRYYAYALGLPPLLYGLANAVLVALGYDLDPSLLLERAPAYLGTLLGVAVIWGGLEEPGWRGFGLPRLQERRSPLQATLLLGLAWGVWHVPLYGPAGFVVPMVLAFYYTWLYNRTGSVLLCLLLHASFTPAQDLLILMPDDVIHAGGELGTVDVVILGAYLVGAAVLVALTRGRLGLREHRELVDAPA